MQYLVISPLVSVIGCVPSAQRLPDRWSVARPLSLGQIWNPTFCKISPSTTNHPSDYLRISQQERAPYSYIDCQDNSCKTRSINDSSMWLLMSPVWKILKGCVFSVTILNIYPVDIAPPPQGSPPSWWRYGLCWSQTPLNPSLQPQGAVRPGAIRLQGWRVSWGKPPAWWNQHVFSSSGGGELML